MTNDRQIQSVLDSIRSKIRWYVWIQGIALAIVWICLTFWCALLLDYVPVMLGLSEMPWQARAIVLTVIGISLAYILYRYILRRAFVKFSDRSIALILERKYGNFQDSLVTSVEYDDERIDDSISQSMLSETKTAAREGIDSVEVSKVFNARPLYTAVLGAILLIASIVAFGFLNTKALALGSKRIYLLDEAEWPRTAKIEVVGIRIKREEPIPGLPPQTEIVPLNEKRVKVSKGSSIELVVRAHADVETNPDRKIPRTCSIFYQTNEGESGRQEMKKVGRPIDGFQQYSFDQQPFKGILNSISFDVRGGDHRIGRFHFDVVRSPNIRQTDLVCEFPNYMIDENSGAWTKRTEQLYPGTKLPIGTNITFQIFPTKPITTAYFYDPKSKTTKTVDTAANENQPLEFTVANIQKDVIYEVTLKDTDGILSDSPYRIQIKAVKDTSPKVAAIVNGIGTAITPQAIVPFAGSIKDDYGVNEAWIEFTAPNYDKQFSDFNLPSDGKVSTAVDFRELTKLESPIKLQPGEQNKLTIVVKANDHFDLGEDANIGVGDQYVLDIVTPDQMSRILERLEVGQRRRLEQIYQEMTDANEYLIRAKYGNELSSEAVEPGDSTNKPDDPTTEATESRQEERIEASELKVLYAQRALLQTRKSAQEILGVADTFLDIRDQLVNNRLDKKDKLSRIEENIVEPLRTIGQKTMPELVDHIKTLETTLVDLQKEFTDENEQKVDQLAEVTIERSEKTLRDIFEVLRILEKYESYSEILEFVRQMIRDQETIRDETKKEQKREAFEDLLK